MQCRWKNEEKYLQCIYQRIILFKLINRLGRDEYINEKRGSLQNKNKSLIKNMKRRKYSAFLGTKHKLKKRKKNIFKNNNPWSLWSCIEIIYLSFNWWEYSWFRVLKSNSVSQYYIYVDTYIYSEPTAKFRQFMLRE